MDSGNADHRLSPEAWRIIVQSDTCVADQSHRLSLETSAASPHVKKYGGRTFAAKGDTPTVPQLQANKGSITMAGALSATANQVTWLFKSGQGYAVDD
jgi:hypothetical protein